MRPAAPRSARLAATAVLAIATLIAAAGCGGDGPSANDAADDHAEEVHGHEEGIVELPPEKLAALTLRTAPVERRRLSALLETTGEVGYQEDRIAHVAPRVPGRVQRVPVSLGDEVRRGQVLAVLDSVELGQAKAAYRTARTREELAHLEYDRERRLYEDRITSEREMLEARAAYEEAAAMRRSSEETLRLYGVSAEALEDRGPGDPGSSLLAVHAPIAGRVIEKHATLGELATPESTLFTIGDLGRLWIWIDVYERDLRQVHLDDRVEVTVEAYPGRVFSGEVTYLSPEVAVETRTVRARIDVDNAEGLLRPGMFATVRLVDPHTEAVTPSLVVPEGALVRRGGATLVFVPEDADGSGDAGGRFAARPVTVGRQEGGWVEVLAGLDAGETVVAEGAFFLESELAGEQLGGGHAH